MALFVVMVVVVVLAVVVFQLAYSTKVEERIQRNRKGLFELSITLPAAARSVMLKLQTDWEEGLDGSEGSSVDDPGAGATGGPDPLGGFGGTGAGTAPGSGTGGSSSGGQTDSEHELWARPYTEDINGVQVTIRVTGDGSRLNLNRLFEYVSLPDEEEDEPPEGSPPTPSDEDEDEEDLLDEFADEPQEQNLPDEEPYEPPDIAVVELTQEMLSRLIQGIVQYNQEYGFEYEQSFNADTAAEALIDFVLERYEEEGIRNIRNIESIRRSTYFQEIGWELFNGPRPLDEDDEDVEDDDGDDEPNPLADFALYLDEGILNTEGFEEVEFDDGSFGVAELPRPLGLRDFLCTRGAVGDNDRPKINLNTARPELLAALMTSFEDLDYALEVALQIDQHLNSYITEEEATEDTGAGNEAQDDAFDEEAPPEFHVFDSFEDLKDVNEEWEESDPALDGTVFELLQQDLGPLKAFKSTFFFARLTGVLEDQEVEGELVLERRRGKIRVLSWRENFR